MGAASRGATYRVRTAVRRAGADMGWRVLVAWIAPGPIARELRSRSRPASDQSTELDELGQGAILGEGRNGLPHRGFEFRPSVTELLGR
jgi:hypothetical protein